MDHFTDKILEGVSWLSTLGLTFISDLTDIISLIFLLVSIICSIITTITPKIRKAKEDGKITVDEVADIAEGVKDAVDNGRDKIKKGEKKK